MDLSKIDKISERLIGWGCIGATATEYVNPSLLALDLAQAAGVGVFGFLIATGRASNAVKRIGEVLSRD